MKFLYKINSGFSGAGGRFTPSKIPSRLVSGKSLSLGWRRYLEAVEVGDRVWVYFLGPHRFEDGVYAQGRIERVDLAGQQVLLRVTKYRTDRPLTDAQTTQQVAEAVGKRYEQVFVLPDNWATVAACSVTTTAASCAAKSCETCGTWKALPRIRPGDVGRPQRVVAPLEALVPAYWAIPSRCFIPTSKVRDAVRRGNDVFYAFKAGNANLAFPLALGMYEALRKRGLPLDFDGVVPIPLSPEKEKRKEIHRTKLLASELAGLLGAPLLDYLSLTGSISKRSLIAAGYTVAEFESLYSAKLKLDPAISGLGRILLVDDTATHGSTLQVATRKIFAANPGCSIVAATAAQMILKHVVKSEQRIRPA